MPAVTGSRVLLYTNSRVSATSNMDIATLEDGFWNRDKGTDSAHRIVLLLIIILAVVNVTSTLLMLGELPGGQFLPGDGTGYLSVGEEGPIEEL